jgi:uncharacterized protein YceK
MPGSIIFVICLTLPAPSIAAASYVGVDKKQKDRERYHDKQRPLFDKLPFSLLHDHILLMRLG